MRISERHAGDATVLDLAGALVAGKADGIIEAAVRRQVRAGRRIVIVNLGDVPSIDAAGLGALVVAYTTLRQAGGVLRIAGATKRIHDVMVMTRLTTVFDTFDSVEQAVNDANEAGRAVTAAPHQYSLSRHDVSYIAMELVEGRPLATMIPPDGLPLESVLAYGAQIADALAHAHEPGILHRDLKSLNVQRKPVS
jgi:anti-sigma B factor antagonist